MRAARWAVAVAAAIGIIAACDDDGVTPPGELVWRSQWSHPLPHGALIRGLGGATEFQQWAVGDGGLIARYRGNGLSAVSSPTTHTLHDVVAFSATDVFMVGENGTIIGPGLVEQASPTTDHLYSLFGYTASNLIAVGANGVILEYDGGTWETVTSPTSADLHGVWGLVNGDVVAVGAGGVVIATDGVAPWAVVPAFTARDLNAVWADKPGDWFAVGDAGEIWQDRGAGWMPMSSPRGDDFHDVFGSDSAYVWAVGDADSILFYDQIAWRPIAPNPSGRLDAIWATICPLSLAARGAARDVHCSNTYFAGAGGFLAYYTLLNTYDDLTDAVTHADLHGIHGAANGDVYAVGDESTIMRYDGSSWSRAPTGDSQLQDVFVISPLDVVVVGFTRGPFAGGCVMEGADNAWTGICAPSYPDFYGVWARNAAEVYIVGNAGTVYRNNRITMEPEPAPLADYRDVWGFESGEPIAVALGGVIAMRDAGTWSAMPDPVSSDLYGVWGTSPSHAYAVGANGVILRLDASGVWQSMISGVADDIVAVSGDDGTVWAVTRTGSALRLDGTTWRIEPWPGIAGYGGVYVRSDRGVFAVGNAGGVVRFDLRS